MGMREHEAKELLNYQGRPLIDWSLFVAKERGIEPLVVSREDKQELNSYLYDRGINTLLLKPEGEWMNTVLRSQSAWDEENILILPDTRFPEGALDQCQFSLECKKKELVAGMHRVYDPTKWCTYFQETFHEKKDVPSKWAFGVLGWKRDEGRVFFERLAQFGSAWVQSPDLFAMEYFKDVTRAFGELDDR